MQFVVHKAAVLVAFSPVIVPVAMFAFNLSGLCFGAAFAVCSCMMVSCCLMAQWCPAPRWHNSSQMTPDLLQLHAPVQSCVSNLHKNDLRDIMQAACIYSLHDLHPAAAGTKCGAHAPSESCFSYIGFVPCRLGICMT